LKNGKRPTLAQKRLIAKYRLNPDNWLVVKNMPGEMHLVNKYSGKLRVLKGVLLEKARAAR